MQKDFWRYRITIQFEARAGFVILLALIYVYLFAAAFLTL
jgi:hypothetical protein